MMSRSRQVRLFLLVAAVMAVFALLAGCTGVAATPAATPTPAPGVVSGHVYWIVGLNPGRSPVQAKLTATLIHASAPIVHDFEAGSDGSFSVGLPPGQYTIAGFVEGQNSKSMTTSENVTVRPGVTTEVDLEVLNP